MVCSAMLSVRDLSRCGGRLFAVLLLWIGVVSTVSAAASVTASDFIADSGFPSLAQACTATATGTVTVTCTSDNQVLQPNGGLVLQVGGIGLTNVITLNSPLAAAFTLIATPASAQIGPCVLTLTMRDGASAVVALTTVNLNVRAPPSLSGLPTTVFIEAVPVPAFTPSWTPITTASVAFSVTAGSSVTVAASSNDQVVLPNTNLVLSGSYVLQISSVQGHSGPVTVTVSVNDGIATVSQTLVVQVSGLTLPINATAISMVPGETRRFYGTELSAMLGLGGRVEANGGLRLAWIDAPPPANAAISNNALLDGSPSIGFCRANSASDYLEIRLSTSAAPGLVISNLAIQVRSYANFTNNGDYKTMQITVTSPGGGSSSGGGGSGGGGCGLGAASSMIVLLMGFALFSRRNCLT